jgi:CrcB protein
VTGFLGGFTTFSAFSVETDLLFRRGESLLAWGYILASVAGGLLLAWLGMKISHTYSS